MKLEHDPGFLKSCIFIGDALISDLQAVFAKPNEWAIDQDYLLGDSKKQSKNTITGSVSVKIGFVPEKENDRIN